MLTLEAYQTVTRTHIIVITWRLILGAEWLDKYICVKKTRCKEILNSMTEGMNLPVATCLEFLVIAVRLIRNENSIKRNIFTWRATFFICTGRPVWCKQKLGTWWLLILSFVKLGEKVLFFFWQPTRAFALNASLSESACLFACLSTAKTRELHSGYSILDKQWLEALN